MMIMMMIMMMMMMMMMMICRSQKLLIMVHWLTIPSTETPSLSTPGSNASGSKSCRSKAARSSREAQESVDDFGRKPTQAGKPLHNSRKSWKVTMVMGKLTIRIHEWSCSIAMWDCQRVFFCMFLCSSQRQQCVYWLLKCPGRVWLFSMKAILGIQGGQDRSQSLGTCRWIFVLKTCLATINSHLKW